MARERSHTWEHAHRPAQRLHQEAALDRAGRHQLPATYSPTLLSDPRLHGRGNGPVRAALLQQMQQTAGNRAVQRALQRATRPRPASTRRVPIQRLLFESRDLIGLVGKPKGGFFYSRTYKKIIAALDSYHKAHQTQRESARLAGVRKSLGTMLKLIDTWLEHRAEGSEEAAEARNIPAMRDFRRDVEKEFQAAEDVSAPSQGYRDLDAKQYRVAGAPPQRQVEEVERRKGGDGTITYVALGLVVGFNQNRPLVEYYPQPRSLGDWYPRVTHLNGMDVAPKSGVQSAEQLQQAINEKLRPAEQGEGAALDVAAIDVLYTYSAKRGLVGDLWECLKGKLGTPFGYEDAPTIKQEEIMMDAVHRQKRVTVSAHSRGTIKTDNAVRIAYDKLSEENVPLARNSAEAQEIADAAARKARAAFQSYQDAGLDMSGIDPRRVTQGAAENARQKFAKQQGAQQARADMNKYIELVYAGNAVWLPTSVLPADFFVAKADMISLVVGSYNDWRNPGGGKVQHVSGGHGFIENYSTTVGKRIAKDIKQDQGRTRR